MSNFNSDINEKNYYGCALSLDNDERLEKFQKQRLERGFDDSEIWSLDCAIVEFALPRLKEFAKNILSYPGSLNNEEEWINILNQIIEGMELYIDWNVKYDDLQSQNKIKNGMKLFFEYFSSLWN